MWTLKSFRSSNPRPPHTTARRWALETLEDRALLSASPTAIYPLGATPRADVASLEKAGKQVTFRGSLDGVVTRGTPGPSGAPVLVEGTGHAAHLGRFTFSFPHLVNATTRVATGTYTFTAANGDTLTADVTGQAVPVGTTGVLHIVETATITGGTGRFAGATGSFTIERDYDTVAGTTTGSFLGTISPAGTRHRCHKIGR
ncbi:hypothetical protein V5E97_29140 [Singulisphaera sp. Ch08]|uniref:Htaa domain-containing protein n=1 Tax=Singulisphaera sp. Ch08 TaxID=3120278 RepID=A0AAU7CB85_9BACT